MSREPRGRERCSARTVLVLLVLAAAMPVLGPWARSADAAPPIVFLHGPHVPAYAQTAVSVFWLPGPGAHWTVQAILHQPGYPDQESLRNVDTWEVLQPGVATQLVLPVRNPYRSTASLHAVGAPKRG